MPYVDDDNNGRRKGRGEAAAEFQKTLQSIQHSIYILRSSAYKRIDILGGSATFCLWKLLRIIYLEWKYERRTTHVCVFVPFPHAKHVQRREIWKFIIWAPRTGIVIDNVIFAFLFLSLFADKMTNSKWNRFPRFVISFRFNYFRRFCCSTEPAQLDSLPIFSFSWFVGFCYGIWMLIISQMYVISIYNS